MTSSSFRVHGPLWVACFLMGLLIPFIWAPAASAVDPSYFINRTNHCMMTGRLPKKPAPLTFCHWFNDNSCCVPGWDLDIMNAFVEVSDLGAGCSPSKHVVKAAYREIREWMCLGCDPKEPQYRFRTAVGDAHLPGGQHAPDPAAGPAEFTWRLCRSWVYGKDGKSGLWGENASKYDECGIQMLNDCSAVKQWSYDSSSGDWLESDVPILDNWDPGMCAGDVIFPYLEFGQDEEPASSLLQVIPQFTPEFNFVIVDDLDGNFSYNDTPCFRGAAASTGMFQLIVLSITLLGWAVIGGL